MNSCWGPVLSCAENFVIFTYELELSWIEIVIIMLFVAVILLFHNAFPEFNDMQEVKNAIPSKAFNWSKMRHFNNVGSLSCSVSSYGNYWTQALSISKVVKSQQRGEGALMSSTLLCKRGFETAVGWSPDWLPCLVYTMSSVFVKENGVETRVKNYWMDVNSITSKL